MLQGVILLQHHSFAHIIVQVYLQDEFSEANCWIPGSYAFVVLWMLSDFSDHFAFPLAMKLRSPHFPTIFLIKYAVKFGGFYEPDR